MNDKEEVKNYLDSCTSSFWKDVFNAELNYLLQYLEPGDRILSVGCGPAHIEQALANKGFNVTGLDVSQEAISCLPDRIRAVVGKAEEMPFSAATFDAVTYIVSLQFIENYQEAVKKTAEVLKPGGKLFIMLLNPESSFFKAKQKEPESYINKIRHTDIKAIEKTVASYFSLQTEYFLGLHGNAMVTSREPSDAALYIIRGTQTANLDLQ